MQFDKELYWAKRKMGFRGQDGDSIAPVLIEGSGKAELTRVKVSGTGENGEKAEYEEIYIPRANRRKIMLKFKRDVLKGRIDLNKLNEQRLEINRDRKESGE